MKKTFRCEGFGKMRITTDTLRKRIEKQTEYLAQYEWDLKNWYDIPEWRTRENIRLTKNCIEKTKRLLKIAIEKGYDEELEEA